MKLIEKAHKALIDDNYDASIISGKLCITAWNMERSDSADFQLSKQDIDKWAATYDIDRRTELLQRMRFDLNMIYETIKATHKGKFYELEHYESFPIKTLLSNIDCHLDELNKLQSND
jgi:hypothetical protein